MDQDNREVRLLQELLLEDGELHGAGRERKFKWKNADSLSWNDSEQPKEDDEENEDIPESELLLRKTRYERETFLDEHRKKIMETTNEVELLTNDSQIMKLGFEALKKSVDTSVQSKNVPSNIETNKAFSLLNKRSFRGSFLTRSENTLSRLAEMTKVSSKEVLASGPKNSRNFVFTSVTKTDEVFEEGVEKSDKKRKVSVGTPKVLKKMRIAENSPGGVKSKKSLKPMFSQS